MQQGFTFDPTFISGLVGILSSIFFGAQLGRADLQGLNHQFLFGKNVTGVLDWAMKHLKTLLELAYEHFTGKKLFSENVILEKYDTLIRKYLDFSALNPGYV
jgi:hypothetical protein